MKNATKEPLQELQINARAERRKKEKTAR